MTRNFLVKLQWNSLKIGVYVCRLRLHSPYPEHKMIWLHHPDSGVCVCRCHHIRQKDKVTVKRPSRWSTPSRLLPTSHCMRFVCNNILDNVQIVNGQMAQSVASQTDFCRIDSAIYSFIWSNKLNARINLLKGHQNSEACAKSQSDTYIKKRTGIKVKRRQQTDLQWMTLAKV